MWYLAIKRAWWKSKFVVSFTRPMQDKKENSSLRKQELFSIQLPISLQKDLTKGHSQKRCKRVSELALQKPHWSFDLIPILKRKQFVATFLCKSLNWNTRSLDSLVHKKARVYDLPQSIVSKPQRLQSASHFSWLLQGVEALVLRAKLQ